MGFTLGRLLGLGLVSTSSFFFFVVVLWLSDFNSIRERSLDTESTSGVVVEHDSDLNTHNTLLEENVSNSFVHVVKSGLTSGNKVSLFVLHTLGSLLSELSGDDDFTTLGTVLKDTLNDGVGTHSDGNTGEELELKRFSLGSSADTLSLDLVDQEFNGILGVVETLLDEGGKFSDLETFGTNDFVNLGGLDSDLSLDGGNSDFNTGVTLETYCKQKGLGNVIYSSGEGSGKELMKFGVEDTVSNELSKV